MPKKDHSDKRKLALWLLQRGLLAPGEIANALHVSRQLVRYWAESSSLDYRAARNKFVRRVLERAKRMK